MKQAGETSGLRIAAGSNREDRSALASLARHARRGLAIATILPLVSGALLVAQAYVLASVLHRAVVGGESVAALGSPIFSIAVLIALRLSLGGLGEQAGIVAAERIKFDLRSRLAEKLSAGSLEWSASRSSGALSAAVVDQLEALDGFFARFLPASIQAAVLPLAFAAAVLPVDWVVGLLFLLTAPLIPLFMALVGWGAEAATRAQADALVRLSGHFADRLRGMTTLKLFGRAEFETRDVERASEDLRRRTLRVLRIAFLSSAVLEFFAALGVAGVALYVGLTYLGLVDLRGSALTLQAGLFCLLMAPEVYQPLRLLAAHYHDRASAKAAIAEIEARFAGLPEAAAAGGFVQLPASSGGLPLHVEHLTIRVPDSERVLLDGVSLKIGAGRHLALFGESGIGKSSLLETLARLRPGAGIRIAGLDLAAIDEASLRAGVAFISQRSRLFHGSIADNIRLGKPSASAAEIAQAAEQACVLDFALKLPEGLDTPIGEGGVGLSGGEGHRVALARLFLRDPGLILLDEPTAHLDAATQARVLDALIGFAAGRTMIIATHSPAVAARLDEAWRLAGGKLLPMPHPHVDRQQKQPRWTA
ncbi:thiol reductant ABC exporter subunit CydD [Labrys portucalensis]|uniref:Thiol reductant ABC exporter subunit CydD n=1 Tax=Labrys neptuniae TaxID=376174 RepID=A0ABV6ZA60_9HYPH